LEVALVELFRSGAIVVMGLTVMAAGIFVVFYG
jgi:hypothetical protein